MEKIEQKQVIPYQRKVQYYETDQMGIVHHSNYIRWMEEARVDFLGQIGIPYDEIEKTGVIIPVLSASCEYKVAFRYGDTFLIEIEGDKFTQVRMSLRYKIYDEKKTVLKAEGSTSHCFLDKNMKPVRLKKDFPGIYEKLALHFGESIHC